MDIWKEWRAGERRTEGSALIIEGMWEWECERRRVGSGKIKVNLFLEPFHSVSQFYSFCHMRLLFSPCARVTCDRECNRLVDNPFWGEFCSKSEMIKIDEKYSKLGIFFHFFSHYDKSCCMCVFISRPFLCWLRLFQALSAFFSVPLSLHQRCHIFLQPWHSSLQTDKGPSFSPWLTVTFLPAPCLFRCKDTHSFRSYPFLPPRLSWKIFSSFHSQSFATLCDLSPQLIWNYLNSRFSDLRSEAGCASVIVKKFINNRTTTKWNQRYAQNSHTMSWASYTKIAKCNYISFRWLLLWEYLHQMRYWFLERKPNNGRTVREREWYFR